MVLLRSTCTFAQLSSPSFPECFKRRRISTAWCCCSRIFQPSTGKTRRCEWSSRRLTGSSSPSPMPPSTLSVNPYRSEERNDSLAMTIGREFVCHQAQLQIAQEFLWHKTDFEKFTWEIFQGELLMIVMMMILLMRNISTYSDLIIRAIWLDLPFPELFIAANDRPQLPFVLWRDWTRVFRC